ncbi:prohead protease [Clostridium botulinum C]|uniref:prohead protease n=1 Tax=Clostridium botulinum TaxID=1491 RepID=UPI001E34BA36|nr:prohead protease [Clostridium botulinum]MCD3217882.1 prohead protease [Clostridium botulinum C]
MNIRNYLLKTLKNEEVLELLPDKKVYFLHANDEHKFPYVEYEIINEYGENYAESEEINTTYIVQVDIFSKDSYSKLEKTIKKHMLNAGFNRDMCADLFEKDTKLYHKAMRFNITLEVE